MLISRTPFRVSFFGGGTDYPAWSRRHRGKVISTTINKYCYITTRFLSPLFSYRYRIRYTEHEDVDDISRIKHPSVRECLKFMNILDPLEMQHNADLPAMSGLGSSSAFTVGFLNALHAITGKTIDKLTLAKNAIHIEQSILKENVGSQDQAAAAFGGFNAIEFSGDDQIKVSSLTLDAARLEELRRRMLLFYTGVPRVASEVVGEQIKNIPDREKELTEMLAITDEAERLISISSGSEARLNDFGKLLHESWLLKRSLSSRITTPFIDEVYSAARDAGAIGGKLLGAGSGGFFLVYATPEHHQIIKEKLGKLPAIDFEFENGGSQIIYKTSQV